MPSVHVSLAHALLDINRSFERRREGDDEGPSLLLWSNLLRVIADGGIALTDLPAAARISRRAVRSWLGLTTKRGWLEVEATAPRTKIVKLTETGRRLRDRSADLVAATEAQWTTRVRGTRAVRDALEDLVGQLELELPHYPMTYGGADRSALGGRAVPVDPGPPRIPPHGSDWVPVVRTEDARGLPLHALLSQALMAFTIDYEERASGFPMAVAAQLVRAMPTRSVPLAALPGVLGVTGSGKSGLERHGFVRVTGKDDDPMASLTDLGVWARDGYEPGIADVVQAWRDRYGTDIVERLTSSLAAVDDQLAGDLPDFVLIRYVPGGGFADVSHTETG